uniref:Uncharacterized protein n=1 Tax=Fagus sylvatica TaxID=28930 RepID=A0A2N9IVM1_FAGSY
MRHWWTLLGGDDHASIMGVFGKFSSLIWLRVDHGLLEALASFLGSDPLLLFHRGGGSCSYLKGTSYPLRVLGRTESWRTELVGDFIAGKRGWKKFRTNAFKITFAGDRERGSRYSAYSFFSFGSAVTYSTSTSFRPLIILRGIRSPWGPAVWRPWTHCTLFDGVPLPGVWGCTGYYPSLTLRQFGGVQYPPRLGDLSSVTFDYIALSPSILAEWREGWSPSFTLRPTVRPGVPHSSVPPSLRASASASQSERVADLERELEETRAELASVRLVRASEREESAARVESMRSTLHHSNAAVALVDPSTGRPHDIVALRRALDESEVALTAARTSMGVMRVQISVLQGDNGVLQAEVDLVQDALESNASWLNREGFPVVHGSSSG